MLSLLAPVLIQSAVPPRAVESAAPAAVVEWLHTHSSADPVAALAQSFGAADAPRTLLVGAAGYGNATVGAFESQLCAALAPKLDVLALDVGFLDAEAADRWVESGEGDLDRIVAALTPCAADRAPLSEALRALRQQSTASAPHRVRVIGLAPGDVRGVLDASLVWYRTVSNAASDRVDTLTGPLRQVNSEGRSRWFDVDTTDRFLARNIVSEYVSLLEGSRDDLTQGGAVAQYERALVLARRTERAVRLLDFEVEGSDRDPRGEVYAQDARDELASFAPDARVLCLVRSRDLARASDPSTFAAQLVDLRKQPVLCAAVAVLEGSFVARDPDAHGKDALALRPIALSADAASPLERALGEKPALFDLRAKDAPDWLAGTRVLRSVPLVCSKPAEAAWDFVPAKDFDCVVWLAKAR